MSLRRWMPAAAIAALIALPLAACTPAQPTTTPTRSSAHTPLFASDEEALKAATDAYAAYLKMSDTISHDGGANPERIKPYVTESVFNSLKTDFQKFAASGRRTEGSTTFSDIRLSHYTNSSASAFLCSDVSKVNIIDSNGTDVTPSSRQDVLPLEVDFAVNKMRLLVAKSAVWSGKNFC